MRKRAITLLAGAVAFQKFQQAQRQLTGALARLMAVSENYPNLKANQAFPCRTTT